MASTVTTPTIHPDAVSSEEKAAMLCDECRNHVHGAAPLPSSLQFCRDLAAAPQSPCPAIEAGMAELPSPAAMESVKAPKPDHSTAAAPRFDCNICLDGCQDPVVTHCGHLFCWPCLYCWLSAHSLSYECPVCRAAVRGKIVPLYGRGEADDQHCSSSPKPAPAAATSIFFPEMKIPSRPVPSRSLYEPYAAGAADEIVNDAMNLRGIFHGRSDHDSEDDVPVAANAAAADTVGNHVTLGSISRLNSTRRSTQHGTAAAAGSSVAAGMIYATDFLESILSRGSVVSSSAPAAAHIDHSGALDYSAGAMNPVRAAASVQRRFGNGKEFVLHWVLICVLSIISMCFICSC